MAAWPNPGVLIPLAEGFEDDDRGPDLRAR